MIDLHNHILPDIDDGAADVEMALALLRRHECDGVTTAVLTPHFNSDICTVNQFLNKRKQSHNILKKNIKDINVELKLASEVMFSPDILEIPLDMLCIEGTRTLCVELPINHNPPFLREVFYELKMRGITPMIVHVERYPYMFEKSDNLATFINSGTYIQANAESLFQNKNKRKRILKMIQNNLIHAISSDAHNLTERPSKLGEAMKLIEKRLGEDAASQLNKNAENIVNGIPWIPDEPIIL